MALTLVGPWSWRHPFRRWLTNHLTKQTRTDMSVLVWNCCQAVCKYIRHLYSCDISDISDNSDRSDSSNNKQDKTYLQDFASVCISNRKYLEIVGPWVCAVWRVGPCSVCSQDLSEYVGLLNIQHGFHGEPAFNKCDKPLSWTPTSSSGETRTYIKTIFFK